MSREQDAVFIRNFSLVIGGLVGIAVLLIVVASMWGGGQEEAYQELVRERAAERTEPVGQLRMTGEPMPASAQAQEASAPAEPRSGEAVTQAVCSACHANDFQNAPQIGDQAAWQASADKGLDTLVDHSLNGFGNMPAQKGSASEEEIRRAIQYMAEESGVSIGE